MIPDCLRILLVYHGLMTGKDGCHKKNLHKFQLKNWKKCLSQRSLVLTYVPWYLGSRNTVKYYFTCFLVVRSKLIEPIRIIWNSSLAGKGLKMGQNNNPTESQYGNLCYTCTKIYLSPYIYIPCNFATAASFSSWNIVGKILYVHSVALLTG